MKSKKSIKKMISILGMTAALIAGSTAGAGMSGSMWTVRAASERMAENNGSAMWHEIAEKSAPAPDKTPALNKTAAVLIKGQTLQLKLSGTRAKITWSSSDQSVASVSTAGKVTAKKKGTATVTAQSGGKKYTCKITVETPKLNKTSITVVKGKTYKLKLSGTTQTVKWSSSDRAVARVSGTGKVRGIKAGECTVTAQVGKKKYSCHVVVTEGTPERLTEDKPAQETGEKPAEEITEKPVWETGEKLTGETAETPTEQEVYAAISAMQSEYPEGMAWTNENFYFWKGGVYSGGAGCAGFAFAMSDAAFGALPARVHTDYSKIRVGDILRVNDNTHSVIVLEVTDTEVVVAEGNYNNSVHWGRRIDRDELPGEGNYIMTRYPE